MRLIDADKLPYKTATNENGEQVIYVRAEDINAAPEFAGWIEIKSQWSLPDKGEIVLTRDKYGHVKDRRVELHKFKNSDGITIKEYLFYPDGLRPITDITHWMSIPEVEKEG